jgi:hypothetical protein
MDENFFLNELLLIVLSQQKEDQNLDDHNGAIIGDRLQEIVIKQTE